MVGHSRPLTALKYNHDGDLIFSAGKDGIACLWDSETGERIGTYVGHAGAISDLDVNHNSTKLVTAGGDCKLIIWDVQTGEILLEYVCTGPVLCCAFDESGTKVVCGVRALMSNPPKIMFFDIPPSLNLENKKDFTLEPYRVVELPFNDLPSCIAWMSLNESVIISYDSGNLQTIDPENGEVKFSSQVHKMKITNLAFDRRKIFFITSSEDQTAKLFDAKTMEHLKTYTSDVAINAAVISLSKEHVILGGGQSAMNVTTTATDEGGFQARLFYLVYETQFGSISGHFGPINAMDLSPDERSYVSGSEDGIIRLHHFDESYLAMKDLLEQDGV